MSQQYEIPYINLEYDQEKIKERKIRWKKIQDEYEECENIPIDDTLRFQHWVPISKEIHTNFKFNSERPWYSKKDDTLNNIILEEDEPNMDFTGVYLTQLNGDHDIDNLTNHRLLKGYEYPKRFKIFGVSDNATQVKKIY